MLDVFFETQFKHLIRLIKNDSLNIAEVYVSTFYVIDDTTSCANEELDTFVKFSNLLIDGNTSIYSNARVLAGIVFQF